ncbi:Uncharacterized protein HZ326_2908 [Fusarium oxysporum f. sp. albedinis]|nr:Uncharacterized protein HZ326_2908 [Fusarium oxysporum f. sp. albedinis]
MKGGKAHGMHGCYDIISFRRTLQIIRHKHVAAALRQVSASEQDTLGQLSLFVRSGNVFSDVGEHIGSPALQRCRYKLSSTHIDE